MGIKLLFFLNLIGVTILNCVLIFLCIIFLSICGKNELFPSDATVFSFIIFSVLLVFLSPIFIFFFTNFLSQNSKILFLAPWLMPMLVLIYTTVVSIRSGTGVLFVVLLIWLIAAILYYGLYVALTATLLKVR